MTNNATAAEPGIDLNCLGFGRRAWARRSTRKARFLALRARSRAFQNLGGARVALVIGILLTTLLTKNDTLEFKSSAIIVYVRVESNGEEERRCGLVVCSWAGVLHDHELAQLIIFSSCLLSCDALYVNCQGRSFEPTAIIMKRVSKLGKGTR